VSRKSTFLIKYTETFEEGGYFCIVMEYCEGGDLQSLLNKHHKFTKKVLFFIILFYFYLFFIFILFLFFFYFILLFYFI
jgi:serine/threonine protein kinase